MTSPSEGALEGGPLAARTAFLLEFLALEELVAGTTVEAPIQPVPVENEAPAVSPNWR